MSIEEFSMLHYRQRRFVAQATYTLFEVAQAVGCHPDLARELVDWGVVEPQESLSAQEFIFNAEAVMRLGRGLRLRRDLGLGVSAMPLVLDLLDRIDELEAEVRRLRGPS